MIPRHLPPVGSPLGRSEITGALSGVKNPRSERIALEGELSSYLDGRHVRLAPSGRFALRTMLQRLKTERPDRDEVVIGTYTCWSVAAAVASAGLVIRPVDVDPVTLDFREPCLEDVTGSKVLALISHHLFGIPNDLDRMSQFAGSWGACLIDDAAQGFGATWRGRPLGAHGEGGVLSFGRGKGLPALGGGAGIFPQGRSTKGVNNNSAGTRGVMQLAKALAHAAFFPPSRYELPASAPFLHLGETVYDEAIAGGEIDGYTAALARRLLPSFRTRCEDRRRVAERYADMLGGIAGLTSIEPPTGGEPVWLRYPVLPDRPLDERLWAEAGRLGISRMYPEAIHKIPGLPRESLRTPSDTDGGETLAKRLLTLPTHPCVEPGDVENIAAFLRRAVE